MKLDHVLRANRARVAMLLHKTPAEIDAMPVADVVDVIDVNNADHDIAELNAARKR